MFSCSHKSTTTFCIFEHIGKLVVSDGNNVSTIKQPASSFGVFNINSEANFKELQIMSSLVNLIKGLIKLLLPVIDHRLHVTGVKILEGLLCLWQV